MASRAESPFSQTLATYGIVASLTQLPRTARSRIGIEDSVCARVSPGTNVGHFYLMICRVCRHEDQLQDLRGRRNWTIEDWAFHMSKHTVVLQAISAIGGPQENDIRALLISGTYITDATREWFDGRTVEQMVAPASPQSRQPSATTAARDWPRPMARSQSPAASFVQRHSVWLIPALQTIAFACKILFVILPPGTRVVDIWTGTLHLRALPATVLALAESMFDIYQCANGTFPYAEDICIIVTELRGN
jgi:hypothetical protein